MDRANYKERSQEVCKEEEDSYPELPSPGYVPLRTAAADQNPGGQVSENLAIEEELLNLKGEISLIAGIPAKERNPEQKKKLRCLKLREKKIKTQLGANVAVKPKTAAERKTAQRSNQDLAAKEADKAASRARMAAHRSNQDLAAKEADKAASRARMAAHRSNQDLAAKEADKAASRARKAAHRSNQDLAAKEADKVASRAQMASHRSKQDLAAMARMAAMAQVFAHRYDLLSVVVYVCQYCGKQFKYKLALERHLLIDNKDCDFVCPTCGVKYKYMGSLTYHMRRNGPLEKKTTGPFKGHSIYRDIKQTC